MTLFAYVKNIFLIGIILIIAQPSIALLKEYYHDFTTSHHAISIVTISEHSSTKSQSFIQQCSKAFKDKNIKGIILSIESNPMSIGSAQMIVNEIEFLKKEYPKPFIALIENNCTGQSYVIASAAHAIISSGAALIGGIKSTNTEHNEKINEDIYNQLITSIAHKRKLYSKDHLIWANGQIFTGAQALKLRLIDKIGSLNDAIHTIKEKSLIDGEIKLHYCAEKNCGLIEFIRNFIEKII